MCPSPRLAKSIETPLVPPVSAGFSFEYLSCGKRLRGILPLKKVIVPQSGTRLTRRPIPATLINGRGVHPRFAVFISGEHMITPLECRLRASECQRMAGQAPNLRVRDILLDMARTWTRLALEAEQWTQGNRPSVRLKKATSKNGSVELIRPPPLPSRREPL